MQLTMLDGYFGGDIPSADDCKRCTACVPDSRSKRNEIHILEDNHESSAKSGII